MNVWLLTSEFPPDYGGGGISAYCLHFARALVENGHQVTVFTRAPEGQAEVSEEVWDDSYTVVRIPLSAKRQIANGLGHWHLLSYAFAHEICRRLESGAQAPDMIEVQDYGALGYFLQKEKLCGNRQLASIPIVVMCHTPTFEIVPVNEEPSYRFPQYWIGRSERFSLLAADGVISPSGFLADRLSAETGRKIDICPLPVFQEEKEVSASSYDADTDILYVGRYEIRKGVLELLAGMKRLWDAGDETRLLMVGGDTWWPAKGVSVWNFIEKKYKPFIDRGLLRMWARIDYADMPGVMRQAKALVVPSLYENFPYVCIEGMSAGLPVIASITGGQAEMVGSDGSCGEIFDWERPSSFEKAVKRVLELDDDQYREMSEKARARIAKITNPGRFVKERFALLENAVSVPSRQPDAYPFLNQLLPGPRKFPPYTPPAFDADVAGLLSVLIPHFNLGAFLGEALESVAASTYEHIEVVIVDDGSTDPASIAALKDLESRSWPFDLKVVRIENGGLANARNVGGKAARGEFLSFLDADDTVRPDYYERCVDLLNRYQNASFAYSWVQFFGGGDDVWINFDTEMPYMLVGNMLASYHVMRRGDFLAHGVNNTAMKHSMEDYEAWLRMVAAGCLGISIPEVLVDYRVRQESISHSGDRNQVILMRERAGALNSQIFAEWGDEIFQLMNANGPGYLWSNGSIANPPVGYLSGPVAPNQLSALRWKFSPEQLADIARMLDEPAVVWLIEAVMRRRLHHLGIRTARLLMKVRKLIHKEV